MPVPLDFCQDRLAKEESSAAQDVLVSCIIVHLCSPTVECNRMHWQDRAKNEDRILQLEKAKAVLEVDKAGKRGREQRNGCVAEPIRIVC